MDGCAHSFIDFGGGERWCEQSFVGGRDSVFNVVGSEL